MTKSANAKRTRKIETLERASTLDVDAVFHALEARLEADGDPERAAWEKRYMKSALRFFGPGMASIRRAALSTLRENAGASDDDLRRLVDALMHSDCFDLRSAGAEILQAMAKPTRPRLHASDLPWLIEIVRHVAAWAHVDGIAVHAVGAVLERERHPSRWVRAWAKDDTFWVRRTALLSLLGPLRRGEGDFALFESIAVPMLEEKEFFIRKAIGWVLRETSKKRPALVRAFVDAHGEQMAGLTRREAEKYL